MIPVHLYGHPADMSALCRLARKHRLVVIEDASEAHGAEIEGRRVGGWGDIGCFSMFANKIITTGEGGILVTRNRRIAETARRLRDHGMGRKRYWHPVVGFNYALGNLQAAVGLAQTERLEDLLRRKDAMARRYAVGLSDLPGIELPSVKPGTRPVCWLFSMLVHRRKFSHSRDSLMQLLADRKIETRPFFYPLHRMPPYRSADRFPVAERIAPLGLNLPSGQATTDTEIDRVIAAIHEIHNSTV